MNVKIYKILRVCKRNENCMQYDRDIVNIIRRHRSIDSNRKDSLSLFFCIYLSVAVFPISFPFVYIILCLSFCIY